MEFNHKSVLLNEVIEGLNIKKDGVYLDGTMGGAGHSSKIAEKLGEQGHLYGTDQDEAAVNTCKARLSEYKNVTVIRSNYEQSVERLKELGVTGVDGILLDLGVSSYQLDTAERGFSYKADAALDMRMDLRQELTARDIVNEYSRERLFEIIRDYGEDRFAQNIAKHICEAREIKPIETTFELNEIIKNSIPAKIRATGGHPSKRTYQAIRIECNRELEVLKNSIEGMIDFLNPGGRILIITFHSLEDRIVKSAFKKAMNPCTCPSGLPCVCGKIPKGTVITRKPILPGEEELKENSRSQSAKLRIFEKQ